MATRLIIDTNLLVLFVVGSTNIGYIDKHKRLQIYDEKDFQIVSGLIESSTGVIFVPNVLTETSNLLRYLNEPIRTEVCATLRVLTGRANEHRVESRVAMERVEYLRLGLTDAVLLHLAGTGSTLLTDDLPLYIAAMNGGLNAINYNHLREQRSDFG